MKVVFVHGRSQHEKDAADLQLDWEVALEKGIRDAGGVVPSPLVTEFPYYGKVLFELSQPSRLTIDKLVERGAVVESSQEFKFFQDVAFELTAAAGFTQAEIAAEAGDVLTERALQNWRSVLAALRLLDRVPGVATFSIQQVTRDVWVYLSDKGARLEVNSIVDAAIPARDRCVIVAHSLGSIIAYNVLRKRQDLSNIAGFVTIGSPLGIGAIATRLPSDGGTRISPAVPYWFNARDPQDTVALREIGVTVYSGAPAVHNYSEVRNASHNKHGAVEYLEDKAVGQAIYRAFQ